MSVCSLPAAVGLPIVAAFIRERRFAFFIGMLLLGVGLLLLGMGFAGFYLQIAEVEGAIAHVRPSDADLIRAAGFAESRVCVIAGLGGAIPALAGAALMLPLASSRLEGKPARRVVAVGLAAMVLAAGVPTLLSQVEDHRKEMGIASSVYER